MTALSDALDRRFDDMAEIMDVANDIATHAALLVCLISSTQLNSVSSLMSMSLTSRTYLMLWMSNLHDLVSDPEYYSFQELKEKAVWFVVEEYCTSRVLEHETLSVA